MILLGTGLALFLGGLTWVTARSLIRPPRRTYAWAVANARPGDPGELDEPRAFESWTFNSGGIEFAVWEITGDAPTGPTVVCSHGWSDSMIGALGRMEGLAASASRVITWDMRGHGESPGVCQHGTGEVKDLLALIERIGQPVVLFGWSLGAGISIAAAARLATGADDQAESSVLGVIAEAPYRMPKTPARAVIRSMNMPCTITLDAAFWMLGVRFGVGPSWERGQPGLGFDRAVLASKLTCPLLVLHGDQDTIAPFEDGQAIAEAAGERGRLVRLEGADHNSVWSDDGVAAHEVSKFIASVGQADGESS
jgi:pimeloyl-ACP methyl ester carboxylesterase